jgi:hypothetical protein
MAGSGFLGLFGESGLAANDSTAKNVPGSLVTDNQGNTYRYVLISASSACACTVGSVLHMSEASASTWDVTPDVTDALGGAGTDKVVGVAQSAIDTGNYGWVLVSGIGEVRTDNGVAAADYLVGHTVDHEADTMADGEEEQVFAFALEADSGTDPHKALSYVFCL